MKRRAVFSTDLQHGDAELRLAPCLPEAERIVALGFRYWMRGSLASDIGCWERAWSLYSGLFGVVGARAAVSSLSGWVKAVQSSSCRYIEVMPEHCGRFCRDECIAVSMIAACQHKTCPAMRACAFALVESSTIDGVVTCAQSFADAMTGLDQVLSPGSIIRAPATLAPASHLPQ